jgi:para-nitrobenzyl esterase
MEDFLNSYVFPEVKMKTPDRTEIRLINGDSIPGRKRRRLIADLWTHVSGLLFIIIVFMSCANDKNSDIRHQVRVESGLLSGVAGNDSSIMVFKGIPFAAPPVGDLRWQAPKPPVPWEGVRQAREYCESCIQTLTRKNLPWTEEYMPQNKADENCLFLNIWTPAASSNEKLPVLVYIPGGAFTGGSGEVLLYDGEGLAKKGIIVVTINYRVGIIGFLALPELTAESPDSSSGNYGLLDQVAALQWVKNNISAFGGDPEKVTISGQSAGAQSVHFLTASPLSKGLFHRAIAQSSPWSARRITTNLKNAEKTGLNLLDSLGVKSIKDLRMIPAEELHEKSNAFKFRFGPVVDGWFLPEDVNIIFSKGNQNDVPLLTGLNADEGSSNSSYGKLTADEYKQRAVLDYRDHADIFLKLYPASDDKEAEISQKQSSRDAGLANMYVWADTRSKTSKTPVFNYFFDRITPWPEYPQYGVFHSSEIPYVFQNQNLINRPWEQIDYKLSDLMSSYWVNFIKTGDPNSDNLPAWPAANDRMMRFNESSKVEIILDKEKLEFFINVWKK